MSKRSADDLGDTGDDVYPPRPPPKTRAARTRKLPPLLYKASVKELAETTATKVSSSNVDLDDAVIARIKKCLDRGNHPSTPEAEAKAALYLASRLMGQHNVTQAEILAHEPPSVQKQYAGQSVVSIERADGDKTKSVRQQGFVDNLDAAMCKFFDCKSYSTSLDTSLEFTFYGIAENTVATAMAFEMAYNLITEWARPYKGVSSKADYSLGVSDELLRMARKEKVTEAAEADEAERRAIAAQTEREEEERKAQLLRLNAGHDSEMIPLADMTTKTESSEDNGETFQSPGHDTDTFDPFPDTGFDEDPDSGVDFIQPDFKVKDGDRITAFEDLDEAINNLIKPEPPSSEASFGPLPTYPSVSKEESPSIPMKQEMEVESKWSSRMQLTIFRETASKIADDYVADQGLKFGTRSYKRKMIKDRAAYFNGVKDSKKIDVRQKRIKDE